MLRHVLHVRLLRTRANPVTYSNRIEYDDKVEELLAKKNSISLHLKRTWSTKATQATNQHFIRSGESSGTASTSIRRESSFTSSHQQSLLVLQSADSAKSHSLLQRTVIKRMLVLPDQDENEMLKKTHKVSSSNVWRIKSFVWFFKLEKHLKISWLDKE